jgi:cellulose synthase/poly-beta-1,6-N-acetylglucosamine synthase-like glycosyltransferase
MAFRSDLIAKYGWPAQSIVEDVEFSVQLLRDGIRTHYCPEAIVSTPMPTTRAQSGSQRRRWELGRLQVARMHVPGLLARLVKRPWWPYLDTTLDLMVPPLSMLVMMQVLLLILTLVLWSAWWPVAAACFLGTCLHVGLGLYTAKVPARIWLCLLAVPLFLLWKIPIYLAMALHPKQTAWVRTAREGETDRQPDQ